MGDQDGTQDRGSVTWRRRSHHNHKKPNLKVKEHDTKPVNLTYKEGLIREGVSENNCLKRLPEALETLIENFIEEKIGKKLNDPKFLSRLRQAIIYQKAGYWKPDPGARYGKGYDILAYLAYQFPVYLIQFRDIFTKLMDEGLFSDHLSVLDIGSGPGTVALAILDHKKGWQGGSMSLSCIERSREHIEAYSYLVQRYAQTIPDVRIFSPIEGDIKEIMSVPNGPFHLITMQNVLAELTDRPLSELADICQHYAGLLHESGFMVIIEPAELRHATRLRKLQVELMRRGLYVYAPCSYIWGARCYPTTCWIFDELSKIEPTILMHLLAGEEEGFRFINTDIKFSELILTNHQVSRTNYRVPFHSRFIRFSELKKQVGRTVTVAASILSRDIGDQKTHIFRVCDGTAREPVFLILPNDICNLSNRILFTASYGDVFIFKQMKVRWNEDYHALNLLVTSSSQMIARCGKRKTVDYQSESKI